MRDSLDLDAYHRDTDARIARLSFPVDKRWPADHRGALNYGVGAGSPALRAARQARGLHPFTGRRLP